MWSRTGELDSLIREKVRDNGKIPDNTCPSIDNIIEELEKLRTDNSKLRELGIFWYDFCGELAEKGDEIIEEKEKEIEELENENKELKDELEDLKNELKNE